MQFHYSAKAVSGTASSGLIEAGSVGEALRQLREQGLFVLSLNTQGKTNGRDAGSALSFGKKRVRKADLLTFTSQLSIMCQSGVDLAEALHNLAEQCSHPALKKSHFIIAIVTLLIRYLELNFGGIVDRVFIV